MIDECVIKNLSNLIMILLQECNTLKWTTHITNLITRF